MSVFPDEVNKAVEKMDKERVKAVEFENGLQLQFVSVEKVKSQYGAPDDAAIVERGILDEGEQFLFTFKDKEGDTRKFYSHSFPFFIAMNQAELNEGDWIRITRTGKLKETKYSVQKLEEGQDFSAKDLTGEIKPEDIPF